MGVQSFPAKSAGGYGSTKYVGSYSSTSASYATVLSVTGMGSLRSLQMTSNFDGGGGTSYPFSAKITIDGTLVATMTYSGANGTVSEWARVDGGHQTTPIDCDFNFESSMSIQFSGGALGFPCVARWVYELV